MDFSPKEIDIKKGIEKYLDSKARNNTVECGLLHEILVMRGISIIKSSTDKDWNSYRIPWARSSCSREG